MAKAKATKESRRSAPELRMLVACDAVSREEGTGPGRGKVSLHGLFDVIWADKFPGAFKPFYLFARIANPNARGEVVLQLFGTDGEAIGNPTKVSIAPAPEGWQDFVFQFGAIPLAGIGRLRFTLTFDGKQLGWPFEIAVKKPKRKK